jgi:hypothetical protein
MVQGVVRPHGWLAGLSLPQRYWAAPAKPQKKLARKSFRGFGTARATGRDPGVRLRSAFALWQNELPARGDPVHPKPLACAIILEPEANTCGRIEVIASEIAVRETGIHLREHDTEIGVPLRQKPPID